MELGWKRRGDARVLEMKQNGDVPWLAYPVFENMEFLIHGFSTRLGGVSEGYLGSMNLSFSRGDREENVRENYGRIARAVGFLPEDLVFSHQTHTTNVRRADEADRGIGFTRPLEYSDVDGLITDCPGLVMATFYADCVPLFFVDPVKKAVGLSHSGWRGTAGKIGKVTVEAMCREFGSNPADITGAVGPSICQDCYEVSEDVIEEFSSSFDDKYHDSLFYKKENGKYQLDLWKANELIMEEAGLKKQNIYVTDICTCCNPELLYSHRASGGKRGNLAAFLGIRRSM